MRRALILLAVLGCGTKVVDLAPQDAAGEAAVSCGIQVLSADARCLYCKGASVEQRGCLECQFIDATTKCQYCMWSDDPKLACKICPDVNGTIAYDECDRLRPEIPRPSP